MIIRKYINRACCIIFFGQLLAQSHAQQVIPLYNGMPPYGIVAHDSTELVVVDSLKKISRISNPSVTAFFPNQPNGSAVLIFPGGGYALLAWDIAGTKMAEWLNNFGITAFVVKYRLPNDDYMVNKAMVPLHDALQAIALVRGRAYEWKIDPAKIGIVGFSAGGHVAASAAVHYPYFDNGKYAMEGRPDFMALLYPVISTDEISHKGSIHKLLGKEPSALLLDYFSVEKHVGSHTPPTILFSATNDRVVPVENSLRFYEALRSNKVQAALHIYADGDHAFSFEDNKRWGSYQQWKQELLNWFRVIGVL